MKKTCETCGTSFTKDQGKDVVTLIRDDNRKEDAYFYECFICFGFHILPDILVEIYDEYMEGIDGSNCYLQVLKDKGYYDKPPSEWVIRADDLFRNSKRFMGDE